MIKLDSKCSMLALYMLGTGVRGFQKVWGYKSGGVYHHNDSGFGEGYDGPSIQYK